MSKDFKKHVKIKIGKREHAFVDSAGDKGFCKIVTVTAPNGSVREFQVAVKILEDEELWNKFLKLAISLGFYNN